VAVRNTVKQGLSDVVNMHVILGLGEILKFWNDQVKLHSQNTQRFKITS